MRIKIIHRDSPYYCQEGLVTQVKHNAHVDLNVLLDSGIRISVDAAWTDYWTQRGEQPPQATHLTGVYQVWRLKELLERLKRQAEGAHKVDKA